MGTRVAGTQDVGGTGLLLHFLSWPQDGATLCSPFCCLLPEKAIGGLCEKCKYFQTGFGAGTASRWILSTGDLETSSRGPSQEEGVAPRVTREGSLCGWGAMDGSDLCTR